MSQVKKKKKSFFHTTPCLSEQIIYTKINTSININATEKASPFTVVSLAAVYLDVTQRSPKGALRDIQKNGCEGDYIH